MNDASFTHRPGPVLPPGALEALVYVRQTCTIHPLPEHGTLRLGRGIDNDLRIDDQSVSRYHLLIHVGVGGGIEVEDLGSANGTLLFRVDPEDSLEAPTRRNEPEARLRGGERRALEPGDFVRAGSALIMVQSRRPASTRNVVRSLSNHPPGEGPAVLLDPEMKRAYEIALRAAQSGISVLITGETGSGKEVFAETIHQRSTRRGRPFLRLNCAALSESLLESQLFGHERGAFTGANQTKVGSARVDRSGHGFLGRNWRDAFVHSSQAAARARRTLGAARGRDQASPDRRALRLGHQSRSEGRRFRQAAFATICTIASPGSSSASRRYAVGRSRSSRWRACSCTASVSARGYRCPS